MRIFGPAWHLKLPIDSAVAVDSALKFAERAHGSQTRPAGEPYVEHLREVIAVLVDGIGSPIRTCSPLRLSATLWRIRR